MSSLRVLHVVGSSEFGGGYRIIVSLAKMAQEHNCAVEVLTTDPVAIEELQRRGIRTVQVSGIDRRVNPFADLLGLYHLYRYLTHEEYEIVHTHTSKGGFIGRIGARAAKVPVVIHTVHGLAIHNYSSRIEKTVYTFLEKLAARCSDRIISVSEHERKRAISLGICHPNKIVTVHNSIDPSAFEPRLNMVRRNEFADDENTQVIGMIGRLSTQKGAEYFIRAIPEVMHQLPNVKFVLAGDGPLRAELEELGNKLAIGEDLILTGFRRDIPELMSQFEIVVAPSLWEGFGLVLLEAMAASKPIVASNVGAIPEILVDKKTGILVPPMDAGAIAKGILQLLQDRELSATMGQAGRKRMQDHFTEETMLRKTWGIYRDLLNEKLVEVGRQSSAIGQGLKSERRVRSLEKGAAYDDMQDETEPRRGRG